MLTAGWNYELPVGKGKKLAISNKVADFIAGGWKVSGIFVAYSGTPFTVTGQRIIAQATGNSQTADQIAPVVKLGGKGPNNPYYDPMSFRDPLFAFTASGNTVYRFGSTGRNIPADPDTCSSARPSSRTSRSKRRSTPSFAPNPRTSQTRRSGATPTPVPRAFV